MKKIYLLLIMFSFTFGFAQNPGDTIVVQTFDYSMTYGQAWGPPRDTIAHFPNDPNLTFEKIIMSYSMRCKDGQVNQSGGNNVACGEWDYSCHTYIHDSTRVDSILNRTASHSITNFNGSNYSYINYPIYNYVQTIDSLGNIIIDSVLARADTIYEIGIISNSNSLLHDVIDTLSVNTYWQPYSYTTDSLGNVINIDTMVSTGVINITQINYYKRYPMAFQIMSFVTPYGIGLDLGPEGKTWYFDLTDYAPIFKGNKRITVSGGGQWQEDMDIKFYFIVGTPPRDVLEMQQIWRPQSKSYTSIMNDDCFEPRSHKMLSSARAFKINTVVTGHGQQGEFIPRNHYIDVDNNPSNKNTWRVWTECAGNPVYPQGGTWIYDRAGWCPGQASDVNEFDITSLVTPGQQHTFDYGLNNATGSSNYWVSSQLISYGTPNFNLDARITDILSPTNKVVNSRKNPICSKPEIVIQNTGSTNLTSLIINYWVEGSPNQETFQWSGNLSFMQKDTLKLPDAQSLWNQSTNTVFNVTITSPNGGFDEYVLNNSMSSHFEYPPEYNDIFTIWVQTNSGVINSLTQYSETSWEITDNSDNMIYNSGILISNTQYRDTVQFAPGCYTFKVTDVDDDGLDFWANNDGAGMIRFRDIGASWFKIFDCDFGSFIHHEFRVANNTAGVENFNTPISIFPNPAKNQITISSSIYNPVSISIIDKVGRIIEKKDCINLVNEVIDIKNVNSGSYFIEIISDDKKYIKKFVKN